MAGADIGEGAGGAHPTLPPPPEMTCGFLIQQVFCEKNIDMWFIGVEVEKEPSAPPPKKNPGSAPEWPQVPLRSAVVLSRELRSDNGDVHENVAEK